MDPNPQTSLREVQAEPANWFDALPDHHRERIVAGDASRLESWDAITRKQRLSWRRPMLEGAALFAFVGALCTLFNPVGILGSSIAGAISGWIWHRFQTEEILSSIIGSVLFLVGLMLVGQLTVIALLWGCAPITVGSYFTAVRRGELPGARA